MRGSSARVRPARETSGGAPCGPHGAGPPGPHGGGPGGALVTREAWSAFVSRAVRKRGEVRAAATAHCRRGVSEACNWQSGANSASPGAARPATGCQGSVAETRGSLTPDAWATEQRHRRRHACYDAGSPATLYTHATAWELSFLASEARTPYGARGGPGAAEQALEQP